ncbi:uncharacterized protein LOC134246727 [Saccostrea cucullata]|uniref:uncharacterized protein LOC134246727 n=1 Tax=Saccostrea cuccullata TaxID=36930 RepID=UPI002ED43B39
MAPRHMHLACFLLLFERSACYENLCRKQGIKVTQSSERPGFSATRAVDGSYSQTYYSCAHTALYQKQAWFQVDLGKHYNLNSVKIFYRNDYNWRPNRFRQFHLDVSNTSKSVGCSTPQSFRCYKDNSTPPATPPAVIDIPCKQTAQYVIIETTYTAPENPKEGAGPMLEICEIDVYGCSTECLGKMCHSNGQCDACEEGRWGRSCQNNCQSLCSNRSCDAINGTCNRGCEPGFWGSTCTNKCSDHCLNDTCDYYNGTCISGCKKSFTGPMCKTINQPSKGSNNITEVYSAMFGVITFLFISILLNIFFIARNARKNTCRKQSSKQVNTLQDSTKDQNTTINSTGCDKKENNTGYQELGPFHYDELR